MKNNIICVTLWGKEICRLQWQGGYKDGFGKVGSLVSFNPEYHKQGFDVDPLGPYRTSIYLVQKGLSDICRATEFEGIPRFVSGSLPDDWGNRVFSSWVESNNIKSSSITPVDKLAFIGKRGMGGFEFVPELHDESSSDALVLEELYALSREIEESLDGVVLNLHDRPEINELMKVGMSAGGKHPKAIIAINKNTGEVRSGQVPVPDDFTHYILKFRDSDTWPTAEIEFAYYKMAVDCGIEMMDSSMLHIGGVNHFLTERFDRKGNDKIHSATLRALCGEVNSYEEIFKVARQLHLPYHDLEQLMRRMVFNYLTCVCDDHDRNFSFLMSRDGKWRLSPAYDETFTVNLNNRFIADKHCMTLLQCNREISRKQFVEFARQNDIRNVSEIIDGIILSAKSFVEKAHETGIGERYITLIDDYIKRQIAAVD